MADEISTPAATETPATPAAEAAPAAAPAADPMFTSTSDAPAAAPAADPAPAAAPAADPATPAPAETKPEETPAEKPEGEKPEGEGKPEEGAPETYEAFTLADGFEVDQQALEAFSPVFKELGLTQEQAQGLVNLDIERQQRTIAAEQDQHDATLAQWEQEARDDKEVGGVAFDQNVATAKQALDAFGTPELTAYLDASGLGNHPEIIRVFNKFGREIGSDRLLALGSRAPGSKTQKSAADILYPNQS